MLIIHSVVVKLIDNIHDLRNNSMANHHTTYLQ